MNGIELRALLRDALEILEASRDELRDLDAAIGDGDLGITIGDGALAVREGLLELPDTANISLILRTAAKHFASANPSTMSALVAGGLIAAARQLGEVEELDRAGALLLLETATEAIANRGGAQLGDKTIIDALHPTIEVMRLSEDQDLLAAMIVAAQKAVTESAALRSQRGRAAWVGERTIGNADGGATAYLRFLEAIAQAKSENVERGRDAKL